MAEQEKICKVCGKPTNAYALCIGWYPVRCDCVKDCPDCGGTGLRKQFVSFKDVYHQPGCKTCHATGVVK